MSCRDGVQWLNRIYVIRRNFSRISTESEEPLQIIALFFHKLRGDV